MNTNTTIITDIMAKYLQNINSEAFVSCRFKYVPKWPFYVNEAIYKVLNSVCQLYVMKQLLIMGNVRGYLCDEAISL